MASSSLFYTILVCCWEVCHNPSRFLPLYLEVCSPHPPRSSFSTNMFWEMKAEVSGERYAKEVQ